MKNNLQNTGLTSDVIRKLQQVFEKYPEIYQVILYGSRAKGNYRNGSDIDLSIKEKSLDYSQLMDIENSIDDLLLPYIVDLSLFRQIANDALIDHINRIGIEFFRKPAS